MTGSMAPPFLFTFFEVLNTARDIAVVVHNDARANTSPGETLLPNPKQTSRGTSPGPGKLRGRGGISDFG